jgi:tetratricopeptide (TPR) repeat protein
VAEDFPDGQLYVDLRGAAEAPREPEEVLADFLRDLEGPDTPIPTSTAARAARFRSLLAGRRMLVLLDNARDAAQVRPLLPGASGCGVLVTSRNRLAGLAGAVLVDLDVLSDSESVALFASIVGHPRVHAEPEATGAVVQCCAGLPLAIRIAASRLASRPSWTVSWLADRLADQRRVLDELRVEDVAVRTSFLLSYANLADPVAARAFRSLGLCAEADLSLPAAAALTDLSAARAEAVLESLVDVNLVDASTPGRYHLHDLLRLFANEMALTESAADRKAAVARIARWCLTGIAAADRFLIPQWQFRRPPVPEPDPDRPAPVLEDASAALAWCEQQRGLLVVVTRLAGDYDLDELAWLIPAIAQGYYSLRACWTDWLVTNEIGLRSARALGDRAAEAYLLNARGEALGRTSQSAEAERCFLAALEIRRDLGDVVGELAVLIGLGATVAKQGRYAEAAAHSHRALTLARAAGNRRTESFALYNLGRIAHQRGRTVESLRYQRECRELCHEIGDTAGAGRATLRLAEALLEEGQAAEALRLLREVAPIIKSGGNRYAEALVATNLGKALIGTGEPVLARAQLTSALELWADLHEAESSHAKDLLAALGRLSPADPAG